MAAKTRYLSVVLFALLIVLVSSPGFAVVHAGGGGTTGYQMISSLPPRSGFRPAGIVDTGNLTQISTTSVTGTATVYSLDIGLDFASPNNLTITGSGEAAIQLDAVLQTAQNRYYLLENDILLVKDATGRINWTLSADLWNLTSTPSRLSASSVIGMGTLSETPNGTVYSSNYGAGDKLAAPFYFHPEIALNQTGGTLHVSFSASVGESWKGSFYNFSNVVTESTTVELQSAGSHAELVAGGTNPTNMNVIQLVLTGPFRGEAAQITHADASMTLYYLNETSGSLQSVPEALSYGLDTAESVGGVAVIPVIGDTASEALLSTTVEPFSHLWPVNQSEAFDVNLSTSSLLTVDGASMWASPGLYMIPGLNGQKPVDISVGIQPVNKTNIQAQFPQILWVNSTSRAVFETLSVNGVRTNKTTVTGFITSPVTLSVTYVPQYYVSVRGPNVSIAGFFSQGTQIEAVVPQHIGNPIEPLSFFAWQGTYNITSTDLRLTVQGPLIEVAYYKTLYLNLYILIALISLIAVVAVITLKRDL